MAGDSHAQRWVVALTAVWLGIGAVGAAQDRATVQMRDGSKFEGRIEELTANGELFVRVSQHDQRRVPVGSVALDRQGRRRQRPARHRSPRSDRLAALAVAVERLEPQGTAGGDSRRRRLGQRRSAAHLCVPVGRRPRAVVRAGSGGARLPRHVSVRRDHRRRRRRRRATPARSGRRHRYRRARCASARQRLDVDRHARSPRRSSSRSTPAAKCSCPTTRSDRARSAGTPRMAPGSPLPTRERRRA